MMLQHVCIIMIISCYYDVQLIAGEDHEPVNERLTFTPATRSQTINIMTREDTIFEGDEHICLRITNLTGPCPGSVIIGDETIVTITENDGMFAVYNCGFVMLVFM